MQNLLPSQHHKRVEDAETSTLRFYLIQRLLYGFYGSGRMKAMEWDLKKAKKAEMELDIDAVLKAVATEHIVVLMDEFLTSTDYEVLSLFEMWQVAASHLIGVHNIAAAGEVWIRTLTRPLPLSRKNPAGQSTGTPDLHNTN
ncbi:hypothetical protein BGZ47_000026 [Haplosporangium gracile]|nr:hypothetical protein BGZ47_000026 [Haplosporangium gracile]